MQMFFNARSIVVIGASRTPGHIGYVILENLTNGYGGKLYAVNPHADDILGVACFSSVLSIKDKIELAVVAVPSESALDVVSECGKKGIRRIVMVTAGFSEVGNNGLQAQLERLLKKYKIRYIGPNCLGVYDGYSGVDTVFIPRERLRRPPAGGLSIVSQSGALGSTLLDIAWLETIGVSKFVSYGNALDVDVPELLNYLANDKSTAAVCMYVEGLKDGHAFLKAARKVTRKKPLIVLKGGVTATGGKAALSHTASLAGNGEVYKGAFLQGGCVIANNFEEFVDLAEVFAKSLLPDGPRVGIITNSGGHGILASDAIEQFGLELAKFSSKTKKKLIPLDVPTNNPLDLLGDATSEKYEAALDALVLDDGVNAILLMSLPQTPRIVVEKLLLVIKKAKDVSKKPIICVTSGGTFAEHLKLEIEKMGLPCYHFPEEAVRAMRKLVDYSLKFR